MRIRLFASLLLALPFLASGVRAQNPPMTPPRAVPAVLPPPPAPQSEFRAVWIATVGNIDWPSRPGLTTDQQKAEMIALLDRAKQLNLNAVVFQVRPACDALYDSPYEPWSEYLTGKQGQAPSPYYDPLAFTIAEAHKRGLELHAWFNPYRVWTASTHRTPASTHVSVAHPEMVRTYGKQLWLDPGQPEVQDYSVKVVLDVVKRYDVDGVHMDDYFYPYPEDDAAKNAIPFPDDDSWGKYVTSGGNMSRDDWRRENVNSLIQRIHAGVQAEKPWVKFGVSPFGIWRPGYPVQIKGFDSYQNLYADSRRWLMEGWVDYLAPQLYWKIEQTPQSFPALLSWWTQQNTQNRHLWPGCYSSRVLPGESSSAPWPATEIAYQIRTTRGILGSNGAILFSALSLLGSDDRGGLAKLLKDTVYATPAVVPASPWLTGGTPPASPTSLKANGDNTDLQWKSGKGGPDTWQWVVQTHSGKTWTTAALLSKEANHFSIPSQVDAVAVSAVGRTGNISSPTILSLTSNQK